MYFTEENKSVREIINKNKILENPLLRSFLEEKENYNMFRNAILNPSKKNKDFVEEEFKKYYKRIRLIAYFNKLIKYFAVDYDKKIRRNNNRFILSLDSPRKDGKLDNDEELSMEDNVIIRENSLKAEISNESLFDALKILTECQYRVLELIYIENLSNIEIAKKLNTTPQNISNLHRRSLKKIKKYLSLNGGKNCG